jgi:two-component SAPR family response regulator
MINCIIIEDEPLAVNILESYIIKAGNLKLLNTFQRLSEAWSEIKATSGILIFCDLNFRGQIITSEEISQILQYGHKIIFVTAYPKNYPVIKDFMTNPNTGYLCKPFGFDKFQREVERILSR